MVHKWDKDNLHLFVKVQPKASKDEFAEVLEGSPVDRIKIRITAPPVDGKANTHLIKFLAKVFKVPKSSITIKSGEIGRNKHLVIHAPKQLPSQIKKGQT